ncbi:hypothetical protein [Bhargavaea ginsengi]|uniref:hypothetical protein n=1 Tax=Bhargavaea ginsengi TaxID=426757 RepID=UPI002040E0E5|nr:hypothetical protein [Bhargavaea ginsengi]
MKVLVVPSWYPTNDNPISGIFFKQQAIALQRYGANVIVAYPEIISLRKFSTKREIGFRYSLESKVKTYRISGYNYFPKKKDHVKDKYLKWLERLVEKIINEHGKPDIIHAHSIIWGGGLLLKFLQNIIFL